MHYIGGRPLCVTPARRRARLGEVPATGDAGNNDSLRFGVHAGAEGPTRKKRSRSVQPECTEVDGTSALVTPTCGDFFPPLTHTPDRSLSPRAPPLRALGTDSHSHEVTGSLQDADLLIIAQPQSDEMLVDLRTNGLEVRNEP